MGAKEASELKEGQRVFWDNDYLDAGTVCYHNDVKTGIWIKWDHPDVTGGWIDYEDMQKVEKASGDGPLKKPLFEPTLCPPYTDKANFVKG